MLAEVLDISIDSAYRRLRGDTLLGIDEITRICENFKVPFETSSKQGNHTVSFNYVRLEGKQSNFKKWLFNLSDEVKKIESVPNSSILYAADDVSVWHHFFDPDLTAFKIFYWLKCILNDPEFADKVYDPTLISSDMIEAAAELLNQYNKIDSTEVWTEDTLNSTLKQVEYFWDSGFFKKKEDAIKICDLIETEIELIRKHAEKESKLMDAGIKNFKMYRSDVMIGNNSILVNIGNSKVAYISNNTFNMISTNTPDFVQENETWLQNLIRKSVLISGVSEKQRNQFFKILKDKIDQLRNHIQ